ncbi:mCpol domain-containing protein [Vibrio parahaemolyticus]|nr:mCpol domain-containing protein [Vibrio parahaemolyticus]EIC2575736.1 mCpol domain-containing protein [Vibrio parahaemolyticus]EID0039409.1 mCpol domain-containing protein [Vibrio parahaemolyticus]MBM4914651.1 mCpol domain-containing protein [Vibrio parahaemolyticus]
MNYFYAIDGDDIGKQLEIALFNDDIEKAKALSLNVEHALKVINRYFVDKGATTIFLGGDSVLLESNMLMELPTEYLLIENISFSMGVGNSPSMAVLALKKAKGLGKNRTERMLDS